MILLPFSSVIGKIHPNLSVQCRYSLVLIGGGSPRLMENADADDPSLVSSEAGISAWRIHNEEPHLQKVQTIYQDTVSTPNSQEEASTRALHL